MINKPININKAYTLVYFNNLILGELRKNGINCWIAGGALRDFFLQKPLIADCDIFFPNIEEYNKAKDYFLSKGSKIVWESKNGMKVAYKGRTFDLVKIFEKTPIDTINRFDFTISMFATDGEDVFYGKDAVKDLEDMKLVINGMGNLLNNLKRVTKFYEKGFTMSEEEFKKIHKALDSLPYNEANDLLNANGGSGDALAPKTVIVREDAPPPSTDYIKYIAIGAVVLLVAYIASNKISKN